MEKRSLSEEFYQKLGCLEKRYPTKVALLLPAMHMAQEEKTWLSSETLDEIAEFIGIHKAQVREVASFYTMYNLSPVGKYHIKICTNVACCLRGAEELLEKCQEKLGIAPTETSLDKKFTLDEEECLGSCGSAPVMMLNGTYIENLKWENLNQLLEALE